jgi:hypothetical protein
VHAHGGDLAEYERRVAPLDAEFRRRSAAIATLDSQLYAAAAVLDASRRDAGSADYAQAACAVLDAIQRAVDALEQGAVLAPVAIPPEVQRVVTALGEVSGGCHDGR